MLSQAFGRVEIDPRFIKAENERMSDEALETSQPAAQWRPLEALDRRVLGVLVEKAKTTPEAYPLSLNAITTGCNQKSNRYPLMEIQPEDVEEALDRLRGLGAIVEVIGGGRVARFRHQAYDWLGVDKSELAVMAELLLRGAQTEGELRGRAARMEPLPDLNSLRPLLDSLKQKGLIVSLTPAGRGHVITHALYQPREMEKVQREFGGQGGSTGQASSAGQAADHSPAAHASEAGSSGRNAPPAPQPAPAATSAAASAQAASQPWATDESVEELRRQLDAVRHEVATLRKDLDDLWAQFR